MDPATNEVGVLEGIFPISVQCEIKKQFLGEEDGDEFFVEGFASTSDLDSQGDVITFNALRKAAKGLKKNSTALFNHDPDRPIGKIEEAEAVEGKGLRVKIRISKTEPTLRRKIEEGIISKFSVRLNILKVERKMDESKNQMIFIIHELELIEVSLVSVAANNNARVTGFERVEAGKSFASAISKSLINHSGMKGGKNSMELNKVKNEDVPGGGAPVATPVETPSETPTETPAVTPAPAPVETPPVAPAETPAEVPSEEGKALSAIGDTLKSLQAQLTVLAGSKTPAVAEVGKVAEEATKSGIAVVPMTQESFEARVAAEVAKALAVPKGEAITLTPEVSKLKESDIPLANKLVYLVAKGFGRENEKLW